MKPWTEWKQCFIFPREESITGEMIWGFIWMRECDGLNENPKHLGWYFLPGKQYAKNKKEIFTQNLKGNI